MMRVGTYARYSSDLQNEASISGQQREMQRYALREDWTIVAEFSDAAISGSTSHRPGFQALRAAAKRGDIDIVLAEALDRLSRDQADTAKLFKDLSFLGVQLVTIAEGVISELHVGLKGTMNALWLKDHGAKTRRGMRELVLSGRVAGGLTYGYDVVPVLYGEKRGARTINQQQAEIVRRIFRQYANGLSPKSIAKGLNREGVPGPRARDWAASTIHGMAGRGTGILNNELYLGRIVWNRTRFLVEPDSGRRQARPLRRVGPIEHADASHLRIISDDLWAAVKARQEAIRHEPPRGAVKGQRPKYLFSGLAKCGLCGAGFSVVTKGILMCFNTRYKDTCSNRRRIRRDDLEARVMAAMREQLLAPGRLQSFTAGYTEAVEQWRREQVSGAAGAKQELAKADRRRKALVDAIADGFRSEALREELDAIERQRPLLISKAAAAEAPILPRGNLAELFRKAVESISAELAGQGIRRFIERIVVPPGDAKLRVAVNLHLEDAIDGCGGLQLPTASVELAA